MTSPDHTSPDHTSPDHTGPGSLPARSAALPAAPWILLDRTTAAQTATVLDRLEQWLAGAGEASAVQSCARACSLAEDDAVSVAAWVGTLAALLEHRIAEADQWS